MVVLIVGIRLGGYLAYKSIGVRGGAWVSGVLGGLISSTATTVSVARRSKESPGQPEVAACVILIASAIVFVRVALLLGATAPQFLQAAVLPLLPMFLVLAALGWISLRKSRDGPSSALEQSNPTELKPALFFGLFYAIVLLVVAAAHKHFGAQGLYWAAAFSGLTDMDAITLSVANLVNSEAVPAGTGWRVILVAAMANLVSKAGLVAILGERPVLARIAVGFGIAMATAAVLLWLGPR
jgi:uncharacterized membrane protein (DUF4010 family)